MRALRTMRARTALFYLAVIALSLAIICIVVVKNSRPRAAFAAVAPLQRVVLDAGHGGQDGGATVDGASEAPINLAITLRTAYILRFLGQDVLLTRADEHSLDFDPEATVRQNKNADLRARLELWKNQPGNAFLSIHLNQFTEERYSGAQVFYSPNDPGSQELAECLQQSLRAALNGENARVVKPCEGVFLMEHIEGVAVTVECGFLSNSAERALLSQPAYQTKAALAIACGYLQFITGRGS